VFFIDHSCPQNQSAEREKLELPLRIACPLLTNNTRFAIAEGE